METLPFVLHVSIGNPQLEITISKAGTVSIPVSRYLHRGTFTWNHSTGSEQKQYLAAKPLQRHSHQIIGVPWAETCSPDQQK